MLPVIGWVAAAAVNLATPAPEDVTNIALSTAIVQRIGDRLWPHWTETPFAIDLLTANGPVQINFASPGPVASFPPQLEAAFPFPNGVPTIVIGEPQFVQSKTPIRWSVTLLHEHFHQWQYSWPQYQSSVKSLRLAPADDTNAMWMLNYPFPYGDHAVDLAYGFAAHRLIDAIQKIGKDGFPEAARQYIAARQQFQKSLKPNDYKYFAFQCWQEGTARYTELMVARLAAAEHARDNSFLTDAQAAALAQDSTATYAGIMRALAGAPLSQGGRVSFYAYGAAEALLLDALRPTWRTDYLNTSLDLGIFFENRFSG
ncbi:MAG: hypothetical protein JOZ77_03325 [Candidatus Eremiobacteraeota bacterium]|nr:hypothetical protein [Candidatus Eremiobacteraeota bacterium]